LMSYLIRIYCPPGGIVLDPFCGSGSTGVAAIQESREFVGIDLSEHYVEIATKRCEETVASEDDANPLINALN
jgi:site-specific DNA-methyltransferase (adenine-specific)